MQFAELTAEARLPAAVLGIHTWKMTEAGVVQRCGRFSPQPAENDDTLGTDCRGLAVDRAGNLWVATNA